METTIVITPPFDDAIKKTFQDDDIKTNSNIDRYYLDSENKNFRRLSTTPSTSKSVYSIKQLLQSSDPRKLSISAAAYECDEADLTYTQADADVQQRVLQVFENGCDDKLGTNSGGDDGKTSQTKLTDAEILPKRTAYFLLALLCATNMCLSMSSSLIAPFFPTEVLKKGGTALISGLILSCFDGTRCLLAPLVGRYVYTIGPRFMLITGPFIAAWCTCCFGANGMSPPGTTFFVLSAIIRITAAFGASMFAVTSVSVRPVLFKGYVSFAYFVSTKYTQSMIRAAVTLGVIIGPAVGGLLYSLGGFGLPFWVVGGTSLILTAIQTQAIPDLQKLEKAGNAAAMLSKDTKTDATEQIGNVRRPSFFGLISNRRILFCLFMYSSFGFTTTFYTTNISLHIAPLVGSVSRVGYIILIAGVAEILVSPFIGLALDRGLSARLTVVIGYALCATGLVLIGPSPLIPYLSTRLWLVVIGTALYGFGIGFGFTAPYNLATRAALDVGFPPDQQTFGLLAGCMSTFFTFGCFLGPLTGGAMHDSLGFPWSATIVAGFLLLMMALSVGNSLVHFCKARRRQKQKNAPRAQVDAGAAEDSGQLDKQPKI